VREREREVDSPGSAYGPVVGYCECGNKLVGSGTTELAS
jgi:hypothetical protein